MSSDQTKWLSISEFASRLCLSRHTVEGLVKTGGLKVFNISPGRNRPTYRIPASELETALDIMKADPSQVTTDGAPQAAIRVEV